MTVKKVSKKIKEAILVLLDFIILVAGRVFIGYPAHGIILLLNKIPKKKGKIDYEKVDM